MTATEIAPLLRRRRAAVLTAFDVLVALACYLVFTVLSHLEEVPGSVPLAQAAVVASVAAVSQVLLGWWFKSYRGRDAVASADETLALVVLWTVSTAAAHLVNVLGDSSLIEVMVPWGAGMAAIVVSLAGRAAWRRFVLGPWLRGEVGARTVIVGAGEATRQLVRSMKVSLDSPFAPVALLDDDPWRRHLRIDGVPVRGSLADLESVVSEVAAELVIVSIPSGDKRLFQDVTERARSLGVDVKILPTVPELLGSRVTIRDVRDVDIADLLGRRPVETDVASIAGFLRGRRVLVTGAGGSIGSELCRQIARWEPAELMMLDRDESALHAVQLSIHGHGLLDTPDVILADIRDVHALHRVFRERRPQVVFHAAALKHLPMLEQYPAEALQTNVLGTLNVLAASERAGVERFVNISTDKAADPVSVLGRSKRVAERLTADFAQRAQGSWMSVRFGNVLGSRGSVLTAWTAQIARGGPVTVTHPDVTRYFMTIQEAVQLVLQAGAVGRDGEVMILDMGEPIRIDAVARKLIEQSGETVDIVYTGLRDGEKLDEVLIAETEADHRPVHELITHVEVPPLGVDDLAAGDAAVDGEVARALVTIWCDETWEPAHTT